MEVETEGGFRISSNFDSGNLQRVEKVQPGSVAFEGQGADDLCAHEFNCWVNPDCAGTEYENNNRTWFHFSLTGGPPFATVRFNLMNLNRQGKLYAQGMRTVYRVLPLFPEWRRLSDTHLYKVEENNFIMSFKYYTLEDADSTTYFAFSFPYSYTELQAQLSARDLQHRLSPPAGVYYHRELLTYTLDGRRLDLLTVTAPSGGCGRELRLPGLFPLALSEQRAVRFPGRPVVLLSARVHPGETPSSHVMNGCLRLLLSGDARAERLRQMYVFKLIPMLNPDGVARGHYRTNIHGANLNRMYADPTRALYPEVHAAKSVALYHHLGRAPADCELLDSEPSVAEVDAQFVRPRGPPPPPPRPPDPEDASNEASCFCGGDDESSVGLPDLSPLKSLLQLTPRLTAGEGAARQVAEQAPAPASGQHLQPASCSDSESAPSSGSDTAAGRSSSEPARSSSASSGCSGAPPPPPGDSGLFLYLDMHGHASKRGCFMYGNHFSCDETMVDCMLLPKLVSLNSANFDFLACNFTERNMHHRGRRDGLSKEGSGRVAVYRATGLVRSYTLECNYNTGRFCNALPPLPGEPEPPTERPLVFEPVPYTPQHYEQVGEALLISILDLTGDNPLSRLPRSEYKDAAGVRAWIRRFMAVTKFGENNILFSPEKTARTMKVTEKQRQTPAAAAVPEDRVGRPAGAPPAGGGGVQRRLALAASPGRGGEQKSHRRPARRLRRAKKLSPGKVEDQENAAVARPTHRRSADALLPAAAADKTDNQISLAKECAEPPPQQQPQPQQTSEAAGRAGPSSLRVKSPVLQPRSGFGQPGGAATGLARRPARRSLSDQRRVLKPTPVKLTAPSSEPRRSASLAAAPPPSESQPEPPTVAGLGLILGESRPPAGGPQKRAPKRKKRPRVAAEAPAAGSEALPACRSLGHLIQLVSGPPGFSGVFSASASAGELETGRCWSPPAQDESATLPEETEPRVRRRESCASSPLSFAGALSSAGNSPGSPGTSQAKHAPEAPSSLNPPAAETGGSSAPCDAASYDVPPPAPRMRRPSLKTRCATRVTAKKAARTLKGKRAARPMPVAGEEGGEKAAKAPRKKLARRASAPVGPELLVTSPPGHDGAAAPLEAAAAPKKVARRRLAGGSRPAGVRSVSALPGDAQDPSPQLPAEPADKHRQRAGKRKKLKQKV